MSTTTKPNEIKASATPVDNLQAPVLTKEEQNKAIQAKEALCYRLAEQIGDLYNTSQGLQTAMKRAEEELKALRNVYGDTNKASR